MSNSDQPIASVWRRLLGGVVDLILLIIFIALFALIAGHATVGGIESGQHVAQQYTSTAQGVSVTGWPVIVGLFLGFFLFAIMEYFTGKTPGKYFAKTKVVSEDRTKPRFWQVLTRNLLRSIDGIAFYLAGFIIMLFLKDNQRLGDIAGSTIVILDKKT